MGQDETYSAVIEDELAAQGIHAEVPIAQTEEPTSALYYFQEYGSKIHPDITILGVTLGNDISQTLYYLGNKYAISETERISLLQHEFSDYWRNEFLSYDIPSDCLTGNGVSPFVTPANIEQQFHSPSAVINSTFMNIQKSRFVEQPYPIGSYLGAYGSNLLDASNGLGHYLVNPPQVISDSYSKFFQVLTAFNAQAKENHTALVVVLFPQRFQTQRGDWDATVRAYGLKPDCFDLKKPNKTINTFCASLSIICLDVTSALKTQYEQQQKTQFLPWGDMHMNERGHRTVGKDIAKSLITIISESATLQTRAGSTTRRP